MSLVTSSQKCNTEPSQKGACVVLLSSLPATLKQSIKQQTCLIDGIGKSFNTIMKVVVDLVVGRMLSVWHLEYNIKGYIVYMLDLYTIH